jgi:hypothetical protein
MPSGTFVRATWLTDPNLIKRGLTNITASFKCWCAHNGSHKTKIKGKINWNDAYMTKMNDLLDPPFTKFAGDTVELQDTAFAATALTNILADIIRSFGTLRDCADCKPKTS